MIIQKQIVNYSCTCYFKCEKIEIIDYQNKRFEAKLIKMDKQVTFTNRTVGISASQI